MKRFSVEPACCLPFLWQDSFAFDCYFLNTKKFVLLLLNTLLKQMRYRGKKRKNLRIKPKYFKSLLLENRNMLCPESPWKSDHISFFCCWLEFFFPSENLSNDDLHDYFAKQLRTHEHFPHKACIASHKF